MTFSIVLPSGPNQSPVEATGHRAATKVTNLASGLLNNRRPGVACSP
ncbi:hypothetical protein KZX46_17490 [Polymorphobacter sp. PAMC 29334]|nr:hypothetical protein [Polymorphobacter sp. PAMC 29334]QYE34535.1 hypothetical protein KZX46_17490 [Polymorphobacter sp. PAMC 29334]